MNNKKNNLYSETGIMDLPKINIYYINLLITQLNFDSIYLIYINYDKSWCKINYSIFYKQTNKH